MTDPNDSLDGTMREIRDLNAASSRTTQHQVSQLRSSAAAEKSSLRPEIVVVSIPDVSIHYQADSRQKAERAPVIATVPFERAAAKADLSTSGTDSPNPALNTTPSVGDSNLALPKVFLSPDTLPRVQSKETDLRCVGSVPQSRVRSPNPQGYTTRRRILVNQPMFSELESRG